MRSAHGDEAIEIKAVPNPSPPTACTRSPRRMDAGLIVVGSTHTGRAGRVLPGSTAERLLHGSPCPVAVAPKGYAHRAAASRRSSAAAMTESASRSTRSRPPTASPPRAARACA